MVMDGSDITAAVAQASGMVSVQANCSVDEAFLLMEARAYASDASLEAVAHAVLHGDITFD